MKKVVIIFILLCCTKLFSYDAISVLQNGTIEEKTEALYHLGYAKSRRAFWYYVKYLNFAPQKEDTAVTIHCREAAAEALGRIEDKRAVKYLVERWNIEKQVSVKRKIMFALRFYRNESITPLIKEGFSSDDERLQFQSLITAAHFNNKDLIPDVKGVQDSSQSQVLKTAASFTLVQLDEEVENNIKQLEETLTSKDPELRYWAAHFLGQARRVETIPALSSALEIENRGWVRSEMQRSIIMLRVFQSDLKKAREYNKYEKILN